MTTNTTTRLGAAVLYTLSEADQRSIIQARLAAGISSKRGNDPHEGDTYPGIIVRDFGITREQFDAAIERGRAGYAEQWKMANGQPSTAAGFGAEFKGMSQEKFDAWAERWVNARLAEWTPDGFACNVQVFLDGDDVYWATSRTPQGELEDPRGHFVYRP